MIEGKHAIAHLVFQELEDIQTNGYEDPVKSTGRLYQALSYFFNRITAQDKIYFTTLFSRMVFAGIQYKIPRRDLSLLHHFRKLAYQQIYHDQAHLTYTPQQLLELGIYSLNNVVEYLCEVKSPMVFMDWEQKIWESLFVEPKFDKSIPNCRVLITQTDPVNQQLTGVSEEYPHHAVHIKYNVAGINDAQTELLKAYLQLKSLPVSVELIDIEVEHDGGWVPHQMVFEPDYLVDVTAVAECFKDFGVLTWSYLLNKYKPKPSSPSILLGNAANFFLDEIMVNPEVNFNTLMKQFFKLYPLECTVLEDREVIDLNVKSKTHFNNLRRVIQEEFREIGIEAEGVYLEPTFISAIYGLQGRLDLYHELPERKLAHIVELKSSKPYRTNAYGINHNNYIQTLLYDLLIRSVFNNKLRLSSYILYSQQDQKALRFAPPIKAQQVEALAVRNELVIMELKLTHTAQLDEMLKMLSPAILPLQQGFLANDLQDFQQAFEAMNALEQAYLMEYTGFIAREHHLAKVGEHSDESNNGMASLWLNNRLEKEENFTILGHLVYAESKLAGEDELLTFHRTSSSNELANFRQGDIGVLYPHTWSGTSALEHQIFKCSIIDIREKSIVIRLRNKQRGKNIFTKWKHWNLEHDLIDSSFHNLYRSLFEFLNGSREKKDLLFGLKPPAVPELENHRPELPDDLNEEQKSILAKILNIKDYFLLWGPPGTGKTSIMLRSLGQYIIRHSAESILFLAYTNRAVDEICEALNTASLDFLRIGSRHTALKKYWKHFLDEQASSIEKRSGFKELILQHRIVVGTLSSIHGKSELFKLKQFDWVIVDEASQILEPMLVGLLPRIKKWVLIGDHRQMPAVVVQRKEDSETQHLLLKDIDLKNLRNSLFERMMNSCKSNQWTWAYDILREQGRMHHTIMRFPSEQFYGGELKVLQQPEMKVELEQKMEYKTDPQWDVLLKKLSSKRMIYLPSETDNQGKAKINRKEAALVVNCIQALHRIYAFNGKTVHPHSIGVITPYRAQIAQIRKSLQDQGMSPDDLSIDTVERYQGGARDIIIISLCTNRFSQIQNMISLSDDGVDRKLNVALTRARQQLIIIGNEEILEEYPVYKSLIDYCRSEVLE
ncbi:MAG: AAA domain-containing protein [Saprospiraceae bacterium]|nr:AAA domain-containing protein [Saprospiraceae bacterium]